MKTTINAMMFCQVINVAVFMIFAFNMHQNSKLHWSMHRRIVELENAVTDLERQVFVLPDRGHPEGSDP